MRFSYFDADGTEVPISSVDALAFRIRTGVITEETLLYDGAVDEWKPAGQHPVFRFVKEEGDGPWTPAEITGPPAPDADAGPESPEKSDDEREWPDLKEAIAALKQATEGGPGAAGAPGSSAGSTGTTGTVIEPEDTKLQPASPPPGAEGPAAKERDAESDALPTIPGSWSETGDETTPDAEEGSGEPVVPAPETAGSATELESAAPPEPAAEPEPGPEAAGSAPAPEARPSSEPERAPAAETALAGGATSKPIGFPDPRIRDVEILALAARGAEAGTGAAADGGDAGPPVRTPSFVHRVGWGMVGAVLATAAAILILDVRDGAVEIGREAQAEPETERVEADAAGADRGVPTGTAEPDAPVGTLASRSTGAEPPPDPPRVEDVTVAAYEDLSRAMLDLQIALGVPAAPPDAWLHGVYLAGAGSYPEVGGYWERFRVYVSSVRAVEEELYRGFVQNRILKMGLDHDSGAELSALALERFHSTAERRASLYDDLLTLAREAGDLHRLLVENESAVSHEPFDSTGLSRDPVVEAVADDPELAEEIWSRLDRIFALLDRVQGVRPVSTLRLQEALLGGLDLPERGP